MSPPRQQPAAGFAGGRFAPLWQPLGGSAAQFRRPLSLRTTPPAPPLRALSGRLNKTRILSPSSRRLSPQWRRRVVRSAHSVPPAAAHSSRLRRRNCAAPTGGGLACSAAQSRSVRSSRPSLSAAVRTTRPQVHIIVSRIYRCGSKAAEHGRYCTFACTVSPHKFFGQNAALSAPQAVF